MCLNLTKTNPLGSVPNCWWEIANCYAIKLKLPKNGAARREENILMGLLRSCGQNTDNCRKRTLFRERYLPKRNLWNIWQRSALMMSILGTLKNQYYGAMCQDFGLLHIKKNYILLLRNLRSIWNVIIEESKVWVKVSYNWVGEHVWYKKLTQFRKSQVPFHDVKS